MEHCVSDNIFVGNLNDNTLDDACFDNIRIGGLDPDKTIRWQDKPIPCIFAMVRESSMTFCSNLLVFCLCMVFFRL
jgi:hypothetical protein